MAVVTVVVEVVGGKHVMVTRAVLVPLPAPFTETTSESPETSTVLMVCDPVSETWLLKGPGVATLEDANA